MKNFRTVITKTNLPRKTEFLLALFILSLSMSILLSPVPQLGIYYAFKIIEVIVLIIIILVNKKHLLEILTYVIPLSMIFESILAIAQFLNSGSVGGALYLLGERNFNSQTPGIANAVLNGQLVLRPYATFSHPNVLAAFLVISMTIIFFLLNKSVNKKIQIYFYITIFLSFVTLVLTLSRTSIFVFLLMLSYFALTNFRKKRKILVLSLTLLGVVLIIFIFSSLHFRFTFDQKDISIIDRSQLISATVQMIEDKPIFGVGLNNYLTTLPSYYPQNNIFFIQPVHNIFLLTISQVGLIGGIIVIYFLIKLFQHTNPFGKILIFEFVSMSMLDHYFLTAQQGQLLLVLIIALSVVSTSDKMFLDA